MTYATTELLTGTVGVGPFPVYFGNVNKAMNLRGHYHTAAVTLVYGFRLGDHGYPSFQVTNDAIRARLRELTHGIFRDATNEDVVARLWDAWVAYTDPTWTQWGGSYWLAALHLDVEGVLDDIGHDASVTRYTIAAPPGPPANPAHLLPAKELAP